MKMPPEDEVLEQIQTLIEAWERLRPRPSAGDQCRNAARSSIDVRAEIALLEREKERVLAMSGMQGAKMPVIH
jgi:hypothetical protein